MKIDDKTRTEVEELLSAIEIDDGVIYRFQNLGKKATQYLITLLKDPISNPRRDLIRNAIYVLGKIGGAGSVSLLSKLSSSKDEDLQMRAIHALSKVDERSAEEQAFMILEKPDTNIEVKGHALMILDQLLGKDSVERLQKWADENRNIHELGRITDKILFDRESR